MFYFVPHVVRQVAAQYRFFLEVFRRRLYLEWLGGCSMARVPVLDLGECTDCDGCITVCPSVFQRNDTMGYIEVAECEAYPEEEIQEAINICPRGCIRWEDEN